MKTLILFLLISVSIQAQDLKYASLNIISNSLIGGIGAGIHKNSNETFWHAFKNGAFKGSVSGALNYTSKKMLQIQAEKENLDWKLCWGSKIIDATSNTMLYNATMNNDSWLDHFAMNVGFLRFSKDYGVQVEPVSLGCTIYSFAIGAKFNSKMSLISGIPYFDYSWEIIKHKNENGSISYNPKHQGITYAQNIIINNHANIRTQIHELIHSYQRLQYSQMNNLFKIYNKYENFKWIHNDLSIFDIGYFFQNKIIGYSNNSFESEANWNN